MKKSMGRLSKKEGITVSNLRELREFLSMASDEVFHHHVDGQKNDFENWIRHSLKNQELADLLRNKKTKEDTIMVLDYFLTKQKLKNPEAGIRKEEIPPVERIKLGIQ